MKLRAASTPIALMVLAAGTAAYAYFVDRHRVSDSDRAVRRRDLLPSFRVEEVSRIEIEHDGDAFALEREGAAAGAAWTVVAGRRERADAAAVDSLVRELELATRMRDVSESDLSQLPPPRARGKVVVGAIEYRFELGADAPRSDGGAYVHLDGEGTFVVGRSLKVQLLRPAYAYRDREIVAATPSAMGRIDAQLPDGRRWSLERRGEWFIIPATGLRASRDAVGQILSALSDARAETFLDDPQADQLTAKGLSISLAPSDTSHLRVELRIGGACPGQPESVAVVRTAPSRMSACTSRALVEALPPTPESLTDLAPVFAHADEIAQMRIEALVDGGLVVDLARKGKGWHERSPEDRDLDFDESDSANNLAVGIANARAVSAEREPEGARIAASTRVTVVLSSGTSSEVVELASPGRDGEALARRVDDDAILRLSKDAARRFEPHPVALRARSIWRPSVDANAVVAIDDQCTDVSERLELRDGAWVMRSPVGFATDTRSVADLIAAIVQGKADAWIAEQDDRTFGFEGSSACSVALSLASDAPGSGGRHLAIVFGVEGDGGVYAHTEGDPAVFVAPKGLRDLASFSLVDRGAMRLDPGSLANVSLARATARLVLDRSGDQWTRAGRAQDAGFDSERLAAALGGFYALWAVHTGAPRPGEGMGRPTLEIVARELDAGNRVQRIVVGASSRAGTDDVYFARRAGIDATFAIPRGAIETILAAW